jgi:c-di-GMP-related signal transduction protein
MQIDETVHGCPIAMVHLIVRLKILALQVKSEPPRDRRLWLRPAGRAMGMVVVAEGIETPDLIPPLRDLGCTFGQGYHYSRPVPACDLAALLSLRKD